MRDDALPIRRLLWVGVAIAAAIGAALGVVTALLAHRHVPRGGVPVDAPAALRADVPMLQSAPQPDLAAWRAGQSHALHDLGWVDAASGVAHLPIEMAMALQAASAAHAARSATSGAAR